MNMNNIEWLKNNPISHRGLHIKSKGIIENTIESFLSSIKYNYPIELDVQCLKDNIFVVFHDDDMKRLCGTNERIENLDLKTLRKLKILETNKSIPLLADVLEIIDGKVPILIEIKTNNNYKRNHAELLKLLKKYKGTFAIQSFNPFILRMFRKTSPEILRGQLSCSFKNEQMNFIKKFLLRNFYLNFLSKPHFIAWDSQDLPNKKIEMMRKMNILILLWTIRSQDSMNLLKKYGDNIIFEDFLP